MIMDSKQLREMLQGSELVRLDEHAVDHFRFHMEDNYVAATLGTRGGAVCAPLLQYNVMADGKVEFITGSKRLFTWECIELSDGILTAKCNQQVHRFTFTKIALPPKLTFRDWMVKNDKAS